MGRILVLPYILVLFLKANAQGTVSPINIMSFGRPSEAEISVCVDGIGLPPNTEKCMLLPKSDLSLSADKSSCFNPCIPFTWNIADNAGDTHFVLNALDISEDVIGIGTVDVIIPAFPLLTSTIGSRLLPGSEKVLRIKGDRKTFTYTIASEITAIDDSADYTGYYIGLQSVTEVVPCDEDTNSVPVCDIPIPKTSKTFKNSITVVKAILKYTEDLTGAEISIDITGDVSAITPTLDIIINLQSAVLCLGTDIGLTVQTCPISPWSPGNMEVDIRIVQLEDGELFDYKKHTFKDCEVLAGGIDATTLEVRWLQFGSRIYQLTATEVAGLASVDPLTVDCTALTLNHCFAYFNLDTAGQYSVTVQEMDPLVPKTDSQVQSKLYVMPPPPRSTIQHIDAEAHRNGSEARTTVCFQQTSLETLEKIFSHYEFVILNYKGQWLKHKLMTHETKGYLCFTPFIVYTNDFDTSKGAKIIVTQRAEDGFTVLASGNTQVTF